MTTNHYLHGSRLIALSLGHEFINTTQVYLRAQGGRASQDQAV
jgi:hypothetical protein